MLQALASSNRLIETMVQRARAAASPYQQQTLDMTELLKNISQVAALQQEDMAASIADLAQTVADGYANDPTGYNPASTLNTFTDVSRAGHAATTSGICYEPAIAPPCIATLTSAAGA